MVLSGAVTVVGNQLPNLRVPCALPACRAHPARHPLINARTTVYMGVDVSGTEQFRSRSVTPTGIGSIAAITPSANATDGHRAIPLQSAAFWRAEVCHIPSSTGHSSWQRPSSSTDWLAHGVHTPAPAHGTLHR